MNPYYVDVRPILGDTGASIFIDDSYDFGSVVVGDETFVAREPARFTATLSNAGTGLVVHGTITAQVLASCARCLCDFDEEITGDIEGVFLEHDQEPLDDDEYESVDSEGRVNLSSALIAALVIEAPFAPVHDDDCAGLCLKCGADLNIEACTCDAPTSEDHPFAGLKSLLDASAEPAEEDS
jgi:uncharacterized protein